MAYLLQRSSSAAKEGRPLASKGWRTCRSGVRQKGGFSGSRGPEDCGCTRRGMVWGEGEGWNGWEVEGEGWNGWEVEGEGWNGWEVEGEGWNVQGGCYAVDVEE